MQVLEKSPSTVHEWVEVQAAVHPDAIALMSDSVQLSYGELNTEANQMAHYLRQQGVGPEVLVGLCLPRTPQLVVAQLAILKAGGAYVPLDPEAPVERKHFMLADGNIPLLITQSTFPPLPDYAGPCLHMDVASSMALCPTDNLALPCTPDSLAYVIYTSGSTGQPKGVQLTHRALLNLCHWHQQSYQVAVADRASLLAGQAFDASVWELWPYLTYGASVAIPQEQVRFSPTALLRWLREAQVTLCFLPTPLAEAALERLAEEPMPDLSLRAMLTGGDQLHRRPPVGLGFELVNNYGPTENTVVTTWGIVSAGADSMPPSIGRPLDNVQLYVLDALLQPVPQGEAGELYIGGPQLARGYLNRPDITAEVFIPNPYSDQPGARLYKTGDLVRWLFDGTLAFVGRKDNQIKLRGFRIELGEIEAHLYQHPDVEGCIVLLREERAGDKRLVAYIVPRPERAPTPSDLHQHLKRRVPEYMIPAAFVSLPIFPLTANGKVDRHALPRPERAHATLEATYVPPTTPIQESLVAIWSDVMQVSQVGIQDDFFQLGGHSLLATQIVSRIRQMLQVDLAPGTLFTSPTIAQLGEVIGKMKKQVSSSPPPFRAISRDAYRVKREAAIETGRN